MTHRHDTYHTVIEAKRMRGMNGGFAYRAVTPDLGWGEAQEIWNELDENRTEGMHEHYFMVRAANDPAWSWLTRPALRGGFSGADKATRDWGKAQGYEGRPGGWIYDLGGRVKGQGWGSLTRYASTVKGIRSIIMANGKRGWYSAQGEYQFQEDVVTYARGRSGAPV
jgi:hypothetical protein